MNRQELAQLQSIREMPCLTVTLPTHRTSPDNKQDPIRLKNLVTEATNRLHKDFGKREIEPLIKRLDALVADHDHEHNLEGLALFVNKNMARAVKVPFTLTDSVSVDETFATRDIVFALNRTPRYWVVSLSESPTRMFEGVGDALDEVKQFGFPMTHSGPGGETNLPGGPGVNRSETRDHFHREFFRGVDAGLTAALKADKLPVCVVGVDRYIAFLNEIPANNNDVVASIKGNYDHLNAHDLGKLVWPAMKDALHARRMKVLNELDAAVGARKFASGIGEVWRAAQEGRGALLLVEEGYHASAKVGADGMTLTLTADRAEPDVLDDAVDDVIEATLQKSGRVEFVDAGSLKQHQQIAMVLRY